MQTLRDYTHPAEKKIRITPMLDQSRANETCIPLEQVWRLSSSQILSR